MMKVIKVAPLFVLALMMFGCGGGGGTATPDDIGRSVVDSIKGESFDDLYGMLPLHLTDAEYEKARRDYKIEEDLERWKDIEDRIEGNKEKGIEAKDALDPESKSDIKDEDSWKAASQERLYALHIGCYNLYHIKKFEERVKEADFYLTDSKIMKPADGEEDRRTARVRLRNKYGDSITVRCVEDQGLWYLAHVSFDFPEELPKAKKDDE